MGIGSCQGRLGKLWCHIDRKEGQRISSEKLVLCQLWKMEGTKLYDACSKDSRFLLDASHYTPFTFGQPLGLIGEADDLVLYLPHSWATLNWSILWLLKINGHWIFAYQRCIFQAPYQLDLKLGCRSTLHFGKEGDQRWWRTDHFIQKLCIVSQSILAEYGRLNRDLRSAICKIAYLYKMGSLTLHCELRGLGGQTLTH